MENWKNFGSSINNAFFFVVDKIISLQNTFIDHAWSVGRLVLLIALLSAGLNYALTGSGLKENMIKIMKATVFFFIVIAAYPLIIGWITNFAYSLAAESIGNDVEKYYNKKLVTMSKDILEYAGRESSVEHGGSNSFQGPSSSYTAEYETYGGFIYGTYTKDTYNTLTTLTSNFYTDTPELQEVFSNIKEKRAVPVKKTTLTYTTFAPAAVIGLLIMTAENAFKYADNAKTNVLGISEFSVVIKGLICGFFLLFTGAFALIEYLMCFLEFMLVASVGVILFPLSIWEGSKFLSEKFIGAIIGFFMKLLFCNIAIFLLLYGYVSMFHILGTQKFAGSVEQMTFIFFSCLLFFLICKSAPGIAQALLTGTPSLNAAGAIGAVSGAVGAVAATAGLARKAGGAAANAAGSLVGGGARAVGGVVGSLTEANAAKKSAIEEVKQAGGTDKQAAQAGGKAFSSSIRSDIGDSIKSGALGLARSVSGDKSGGSSSGGGGTNPHSWRADFNNSRNADGSSQSVAQHLDKRRDEGAARGKSSAGAFITENNLSKPEPPAPRAHPHHHRPSKPY